MASSDSPSVHRWIYGWIGARMCCWIVRHRRGHSSRLCGWIRGRDKGPAVTCSRIHRRLPAGLCRRTRRGLRRWRRGRHRARLPCRIWSRLTIRLQGRNCRGSCSRVSRRILGWLECRIVCRIRRRDIRRRIRWRPGCPIRTRCAPPTDRSLQRRQSI